MMTSPTDVLHDEPDDNPHDHLWPTVPNPGRAWMDRAKCVTMTITRDKDPFDPVGRPNKQQLAEKVCAGCPVVRECALYTLYHRDQGTTRAATFIPNHAEGIPLLPGLIARLERIAGIGATKVAA